MRWAILDAVPAEQARAVLAVARKQEFARGESVFLEGDHGDCLYLLESGKIAIRVTTPMGDVATVRIIVPGQVFGELAVISPGRRNATALALEPTFTRAVHRDQLNRIRQQYPGVDRVLVEALTAEVRRLSTELLQTMYTPLPQRIAGRLLDLADIYATTPGQVTVPLTQEDLAGLCGATRPSTNQVLKQMQADGLIELARGKLIVRDQRGLSLMVNGSVGT